MFCFVSPGLIKKFEKAVSVRLTQTVDVKNDQKGTAHKLNATTVEETEKVTDRQNAKEKGDQVEQKISQEGLTIGSEAKEITLEGLWEGFKLKKDLHFGNIPGSSWKSNKPIVTKVCNT